jgi:glycosyltransferase involved in cell wall biosynthesis
MKPRIAIHWAGDPTSGGPARLAQQLLTSDVAQEFELLPLHQERPAAGPNIGLVAQFLRQLKVSEVDLVQVSGLGNEGFHAALAARLARRPVLLVIHGTVRDLAAPKNKLRNAIVARVLEPMTLRMASRIVTVAAHPMERSFLRRHAPKLGTPIVNGTPPRDAISAAASARLRSHLGLADDDIVCVNVGRLSLEKGHRHLADAVKDRAAELRAAKFRLLLAGEGPDAEDIRVLYEPVGDIVRFLGVRTDVEVLLRVADMFCFPTLHENMSLALLEAMAHGLAIVATDIPGNREALGPAGLMVPPADPVALGTAITTLTLNPEERSRLGLMARERQASLFTLAGMLDKYRSIYRETIGHA